MQNLTIWTDDHLPCVGFEHNGFDIDVCWTAIDLYGKLDMVESGDVAIEIALKNYPDLLAILNDPLNCPESDGIEVVGVDDLSDDSVAEYMIDIGYVNVRMC